ncbi:MAG: hypothetical protein QW279_15475 [Candidatus Jordarchaeaceae archaeon]
MLQNFIADFLLRADLLLKEIKQLSKYKELDEYTVEILSANNFMKEKINELNAQVITLLDLLYEHPCEPNILMALKQVITHIDDLDKRFKLHLELLMLYLKTYQLYLKKYQHQMKALLRFTRNICDLAGLDKSIISVPSIYRYASLSFKPHRNREYILCIPFLDLRTPRKWVLLTHELGHIMWQQIEQRAREKILTELQEKIMNLSPDFETGISFSTQWVKHWFPELYADAAGISLAGPAFSLQSIHELFSSTPRSEWRQRDPYHPPPDVRMKLQLHLIQKQNVWKEESTYLKNIWNEFLKQTSEEELTFPFDREIVEFTIKSVADLIGRIVISDFWNEIIEIKEKLERRSPVHGPLIVIALAFLDSRFKVHNDVFRLIAEEKEP